MIRLLDFARLVRLPNVFTAMADIGLAALATGLALPERLLPLLFVLSASVALYWSGMIFNDYFDIEQDKRERAHRPLASGRIAAVSAFRLASFLMVLGLAFAALADWTGDSADWRALPTAIALCVAILLYDGWLKATRAGPVVMGSCRFFNVLLGLSIASQPLAAWGVALALVLGAYITGVTWFARTEAHISNQRMLIVGAAFMATGLVIALTVPPLAAARWADAAHRSGVSLSAHGIWLLCRQRGHSGHSPANSTACSGSGQTSAAWLDRA